MSMLSPPWQIPTFEAGHTYCVGFMPTSTAAVPVLNPDTDTSTAAYFSTLTSPGDAPALAPALPEPPRVGRPNRGDRATVKASRRAARRSR